MKKVFLVISLCLFAVFITAGCKKNQNSDNSQQGGNGDGVITIGIAKLLPHPALDAVEKGITDELKEKGMDKKVKFSFQNANAEPSIANTIAGKFKQNKTDIVVGIGTPIAIALANTIKDSPVIFAAITDPVSAGLVKDVKKGSKNVTGVSDATDIETQIKNFKKIYDFKVLGLIYTSSEDNAIVMQKRTAEICKKMGIKLVAKAISGHGDLKLAAESLATEVDAFYIITDNIVCSGLSSITTTAKDKKIPVFSADPASSLQFGGVLYTSGVDYNMVGRATGKIIIDLMNGKKTEDMPTVFMTKTEETMTIVDTDAEKRLGIKVPDSLVSDRTIYLDKNKRIN